MAMFKTRARTLDMLGRQQIAGIPTAISELFKNAHDAYADRVEVDFFRADRLFILRDDGLGMTRTDFESRWLTLGTESKLNAGVGLAPPALDTTKPERPILGEKGIGRLAIAAIGPQVLVLTRAKCRDGLSPLTAAFIHWGLFGCAAVDLDQIEIPLRTFPVGDLPTREDIAGLVAQFRQNIEKLAATIGTDTAAAFDADLNLFDVDPNAYDGSLDGPCLRHGSGTHFYILPADEALAADIDGTSNERDDASPLIKMLVGFVNTMTPDHPPPRIKTVFRDHTTEETYEDLIDAGEFWSPDEFRMADHHIRGTFDEYGQFSGTVSVYRAEPVDHIVPWLTARGRRTDCGPFSINIAYVQGAARESLLTPDVSARISRKLAKVGGLYIYKDDVRILPYGNNGYDFLGIERNRNKSAGYYYFSYRRIFGVIEISQERNAALNEKAGREGFRENRAYRQFRDILMNFFVQIAADFFRQGGPLAEPYHERKAEIDRIERARRKREQQVSAKRSAFRTSVHAALARIDDGEPQRRLDALFEAISRDLEAASAIRDHEQAAVAFIDAEASARHALEDLRRDVRIVKPRGVALPKQLAQEWEDYQQQSAQLDAELFEPAVRRIDDIMGRMAAQARLAVDKRQRIDRALQDRIVEARRATQTSRRETDGALKDVSARIVDVTRGAVTNLEASMDQVLSEFARLDVSSVDDAALIAIRGDLEGRVGLTADQTRRVLDEIRDQLRSIEWSSDERGQDVDAVDMAEALDAEVLALRERSELDLELTQLGMAIETINHEFEASIKAVRTNLARLRTWADVNEDLQDVYRNIRASFEHLDGYLTLFTPLHRRLYRQAVEISGADIAKFLDDLFKERLHRHDVALRPTPEFRRKTIMGYPSTFYPVFVNLIDNALFWLRDHAGPREVILDVDGDALIVRDTGPGIAARDRERIFDLGFTRKPGGRGMGLHISRDVLARETYRLIVADTPPSDGACFRIEPINVGDPSTTEEAR